jgi:hypothetical protein
MKNIPNSKSNGSIAALNIQKQFQNSLNQLEREGITN